MGMSGFGGFIFFLDLPTFHANLVYAKKNIDSFRGKKANKWKPQKVVPILVPTSCVGVQADLLEHWRHMKLRKLEQARAAQSIDTAAMLSDM